MIKAYPLLGASWTHTKQGSLYQSIFFTSIAAVSSEGGSDSVDGEGNSERSLDSRVLLVGSERVSNGTDHEQEEGGSEDSEWF